MRNFLCLVALVAVIGFFSGCINYHSPMIYDSSSGDKKAVKNDETVFIVFGFKARVDKVSEYLEGKGLEVMRKYTVDEERDAGSDIGVWIFRIRSGDKCFIPISNKVLQSGKICDAQIKKIEEFVGKKLSTP